jgi:hypothetical protein
MKLGFLCVDSSRQALRKYGSFVPHDCRSGRKEDLEVPEAE